MVWLKMSQHPKADYAIKTELCVIPTYSKDSVFYARILLSHAIKSTP